MRSRTEHQLQLEKEHAKLNRLLRLRERVEVSIAKTKRRIAAWAELIDGTETGELVLDLDLGGLSDACRTVLRSSRKDWMTIADIMQSLRELGFVLSDYKAPAASITTTVNRMVDETVVEINKRGPSGGNEYRWVGPKYGATNSLANQMADAKRGSKARNRYSPGKFSTKFGKVKG